MKNRNLYDSHGLKQVAGWNFCLLALQIPLGLLSASALAGAVSAVAQNEPEKAFSQITLFVCCSFLQLSLTVVKKTAVERKISQAQQRFRQSLYRRFMSGDLPLHKSEPTAFSTLFRRDAQQISDYYTSVLPGFWVAAAGYLSYALYIGAALKGWLFVICMTVFGLLNLLQPIILEKFLMKNFIEADQAEAKVEQHILSGKEGFATLKLLDLHGWFMEKYRQKQKAYWKAGIKASASGTFNCSMEDINRFLQTLGLVVILGWAILRGQIGFEAALQIYVLSAQVYGYVSTVVQIRQNSAAYRAALEQMEKYLPEESEIGIAQRCDVKVTANTHVNSHHVGDTGENEVLTVSDLRYEIGEKQLFENIGFSINAGEKCVLRGENGAGKSTLFSLILEEVRSAQGIIRKASPSIAYCPQAAPTLHCSARELYENALSAQSEISRKMLYQYARTLGLAEADLEKPIHQLSGGTQKKVILSLALSKDAQLLLLDEPEAMLDREAANALLSILKKQKRAMLIISHSYLFDGMADSVFWLENGKLRNSGSEGFAHGSAEYEKVGQQAYEKK